MESLTPVASHKRYDILLTLILICLLYYLNLHELKKLFWFFDEFDQLSSFNDQGYFSWLFEVFAENFTPVFKLLWSGALYLFHGSYLAEINLIWATHLLNACLLGLLLAKYNFSRIASLIAVTTFALPACLIESLAWSVQWTAVLAEFFFLTALLAWITSEESLGRKRTIFQIITILACLAAPFSFVRGILMCVIVVVFIYLHRPNTFPEKKSRLMMIAILCLLSALVTLVMISGHGSGNHHHLQQMTGEQLMKMWRLFLACLFLNPFTCLLKLPLTLENIPYFPALLKTFIVSSGFIFCWQQKQKTRLKLLTIFLLFDIGNSFLIALGRYHYDFVSAIGLRYQYDSLIALAPFLAALIDFIFQATKAISTKLVASLVLLLHCLWLYTIVVPWPNEMKEWAQLRGTDGREYFKIVRMKEEKWPEKQWIGIAPGTKVKQTKELIRKYHLH